jgi:hypothetical protein
MKLQKQWLFEVPFQLAWEDRIPSYMSLEDEHEVSFALETADKIASARKSLSPPSPKKIALIPEPNHLYRIQKEDTLLKVAGTAYKVNPGSQRLRQAQLINRHPFNWRYYTLAKQSFTKKYFSEGIISFYPHITCDDASLNFPFNFPPTGKCYPLIFIPPKTDIWFQRPPEEVQPDSHTCWAAAILSWSKATLGARKFKSISDVVDTFSKFVLIKEGMIEKRIVNARGSLIRGQRTLELLASKLESSLIIKDRILTIEEIHSILDISKGSVIVLKSTKNKKVGHASVIFGISKSDGFLGEMDPFPNPKRPTGPAFGSQKARWLPTFNTFKIDANDKEPWEEFAFLFQRK